MTRISFFATMNSMTKAQLATKKDIKRLEKAIEANRKAIKNLEERSLAFEWKIEQRLDNYQQEVKKMITDFKDEILRHLNGTVKELETI